ncbi:CBS domain-containing protein [Micromonospora lutea]|uniref:CBS domain-containing protein n=1 Tax=Micromonospora lutea TaxID=419825 RepID=A0ABQ4IP78_9ACTN|nr:CBS domain-containing protein [Micromonospora lutea]GIJ19727.1 hypothetical protein Vlu01_03510 [Micromonospora lutea]
MRSWQVRDVMSTDVATVQDDTPYREIVDVLMQRHVSAVPVVDRFQHVVGVVSEADLVHLRSDAEIRHDVVQEVLRRVLAVQDGLVQVTVHDGVVRLSGRLDRKTSVEIAGRLAAQVSGVVQVVNELWFDFDDTQLVEGWSERSTFGGIT